MICSEEALNSVKGPVFCFPGVVVGEASEILPDGPSHVAHAVWRDRLASAPPWLQAQIRTVAAGVAAYESMGRHGIEPAAITSHSLGINAALHAAGSLDAETALSVAWKVGELLDESWRQSPGGLLAVVGLRSEEVEAIVRSVGGTLRIAARNTGSQFVLGGSEEDLDRAQEAAGDALQVDRIDAGGPLHTPLMDPVVRRLEAFVRGLDLRAPERPYLCHRGARYLRTGSEVREALARQIRDPVLWAECLERLGREGAWLFVDMGPGAVLKKTVRWVIRTAKALALAEGDSPETVAAALRDRAAVPEGSGT